MLLLHKLKSKLCHPPAMWPCEQNVTLLENKDVCPHMACDGYFSVSTWLSHMTYRYLPNIFLSVSIRVFWGDTNNLITDQVNQIACHNVSELCSFNWSPKYKKSWLSPLEEEIVLPNMVIFELGPSLSDSKAALPIGLELGIGSAHLAKKMSQILIGSVSLTNLIPHRSSH